MNFYVASKGSPITKDSKQGGGGVMFKLLNQINSLFFSSFAPLAQFL